MPLITNTLMHESNLLYRSISRLKIFVAQLDQSIGCKIGESMASSARQQHVLSEVGDTIAASSASLPPSLL